MRWWDMTVLVLGGEEMYCQWPGLLSGQHVVTLTISMGAPAPPACDNPTIPMEGKNVATMEDDAKRNEVSDTVPKN